MPLPFMRWASNTRWTSDAARKRDCFSTSERTGPPPRRMQEDGYLIASATTAAVRCSYNVGQAAFGEIVYEDAVDARTHVTVVEKRMQGRDHPVLLGVPETYYLKCFILRKVA